VSLYQLVWDEDEHDAPSVMPSLAFEWNTPTAPPAPARPTLRAVDGETRAVRVLTLVRAAAERAVMGPAAHRSRERSISRPSARRGGVHSLLAARPPPA
jgi:hypothetical protein